MDPYTAFVYGIRSPYTKESNLRRLRGFFDAINLDKGKTLEERCNIFVHKGRSDPNWAFNGLGHSNHISLQNKKLHDASSLQRISLLWYPGVYTVLL